MLNLNVTKDGETLCVALEGRLDTVSSPELEECLREDLPGMTLLVLDFEKLDYISSAGLRVLLQAHKRMNGQGRMVLRNVGESILEIFEVTGFTEILTIEEGGPSWTKGFTGRKAWTGSPRRRPSAIICA